MIFGTWIKDFVIGLGDNRIGQGLPETRPAGTAFIFRIAVEQGQEAGRANKGSVAFFLGQGAAPRTFSIFLEQDAIGGLWQEL